MSNGTNCVLFYLASQWESTALWGWWWGGVIGLGGGGGGGGGCRGQG